MVVWETFSSKHNMNASCTDKLPTNVTTPLQCVFFIITLTLTLTLYTIQRVDREGVYANIVYWSRVVGTQWCRNIESSCQHFHLAIREIFVQHSGRYLELHCTQ